MTNLVKDSKLSTKLSKISSLIKTYSIPMQNNEISDKKSYNDKYDLVEAYLKEDDEIQKIIKYVREYEIYTKIYDNIYDENAEKDIWEIYGEFEKYYSTGDRDSFKYNNIYNILEKIISLIKQMGDDYDSDYCIKKCINMLVYHVIGNINKAKDTREKIRLAKEFIDSGLSKEYIQKFIDLVDVEIKNRIILEEKGVKIADKDKCPKLLEVIDRDSLFKKNDRLAQEKLDKNDGEIKEDDLTFVRLVEKDRISRLGVLEPIGEFSEPRKTKSFFEDAIKEAYPNENEEDFEQRTTENRQSVHFVVNALVTDHAYGKFSNGNVIYLLSWEDFEDKALNLLSADSYIKGSAKAKTALISIQNYNELIQDEEIKKEFDRLNIVLFDEEEIKKYITDESKIYQYALELYLNSQNKVFGEISTQYYNFEEGEYAKQYLQGVEGKIQSLCQQKGISHVTHIESEHNEQDIQIGVKNKRKEIELFIEMVKKEASSYLGEDFDYQPILKALGYINGVGYSDDEGQVILEEEYKEREMFYENKLVDFLKKIPPEKFKEIIEKYNDVMMERYKVARKEKDEEYLSEGLINQEDFEILYGDKINEEKGEK